MRVDFVPPGKGSVVRRYDPKKRTLTMSTALLEQPTKFQLAATIGLRVLDESQLDERLAKAFGPKHGETPRLIKIHLANYFAGALLLPYEDFIGEVERTRYDIELLVEPVRDVLRGRRAPRVQPRRSEAAGHSDALRALRRGRQHLEALLGDRAALPRGVGLVREVGGAQRVLEPVGDHAAVLDDARRRDLLLLRARSTAQPQQGSLVRGTTYSIGLGTHADAARHLAYAQDMPYTDAKMAIPVGVSCRFCERTDCNQRAAPSLQVPLQRRRVHEEGQFLLSARRDRPIASDGRVGRSDGRTPCTSVATAMAASASHDSVGHHEPTRFEKRTFGVLLAVAGAFFLWTVSPIWVPVFLGVHARGGGLAAAAAARAALSHAIRACSPPPSAS